MEDVKQGRTLTSAEAARSASNGAALGKTFEQVAAEAGVPEELLHARRVVGDEIDRLAAEREADKRKREEDETARVEAVIRAAQRRRLAEEVLVGLAASSIEITAERAAEYAVGAADALIRRLGEGG